MNQKNRIMDFLSLCKVRYSVRNFMSKKPEKAAIEYIMECVRMAPSAVNFQPWKFKYITDEAELAQLCECYARDWMKKAPACFIAYCDHGQEWVRKSDGKPHGDIDVAIAVEHLCLAAAEQGLGTCWVCNFDVEKCRQYFPGDEGCEPVALIPIGYPDGEAAEKKRKPMSDILSGIGEE